MAWVIYITVAAILVFWQDLVAGRRLAGGVGDAGHAIRMAVGPWVCPGLPIQPDRSPTISLLAMASDAVQ